MLGVTRSAAHMRTRGCSRSTSPAALALPGVHAVLTHADVPGEDLRPGVPRPAGAGDRSRALLRRARRARRGRASGAGAPRGRADPRRVRAARRRSPTRSARPRSSRSIPDRPTLGHGYRDDAAQRRPPHRDPPRRPGREGDVRSRASTRSGSRIRRSSGPSRASPSPTARAASTSTSRRSGCTSTATRSRRASACARAGAHPPRRRRRRVRRPRGPVDADPRGDARAAHGPTGEDGLQPRGVVHRPRAPPSGARSGASTARRARAGSSGSGCGSCSTAAPTPRSTAVVLERGLVRRRPVPRRQRADRVDVRLHEQPALRGDARLRRRADLLRRRGADGQARRRARHRPGRAAAAERARAGRRPADRPGDHRARCPSPR